MRVLIAPDKFKGTLSAGEAARAIATGWLRARPEDGVEVLPMADGGEGTLDALVAGPEGERRRARVTGPLGDPIDAEYGLMRAGAELVAVVEMAGASGLALVPEHKRDPRRTSTRGTGELIAAALGHGPSRMIVCIGGSATNDGGAGMAQALGVRLLDAAGGNIGAGGEALLELSRIDMRDLDRRAKETRFSVACDVDNPLVGPTGASAVYGPQKGASPADVILLDRALGHFAAVINEDLGIDIRHTPGSGAAGGLGAGLIAFLGARLRPGIDVVMDAVGFPEKLAACDLVVTGEGSFDGQSLHGKTAMGVVDAARERQAEVAILCGRKDIEAPGIRVESLTQRFGIERAMNDTRAVLVELASEFAASWQVDG